MQDIISKLTVKDDKYACAIADRIISESRDTDEWYEYGLCKQLFAELWDGHTPLRLIGVSLNDLTKEEPSQISLFPDEKKERSRKLDAAYDAIHKKFGASAIQRGSSLQSKLDVGKKYKTQMEVHNDPNRKT